MTKSNFLSFRFILVANDHPTNEDVHVNIEFYFWMVHSIILKESKCGHMAVTQLESIQLNPLNHTVKNTSFKLALFTQILKNQKVVCELRLQVRN